MNALIIGCYGLFLLIAGFNGKSGAVISEVKTDMPGFIPWAISLAVLAVMNENEYTHKIAKPFIMLLILSFILSNFDNLKSEFQKLSTLSNQGA